MSREEGLPEKNRGQSGIYHSTTTGMSKLSIDNTRTNMCKLKGESTNFTHARCQVSIRKRSVLD